MLGTWGRRYRLESILMLVALVNVALFAIYLSGITWQDGFLRDPQDFVVGRDFINGWMMGHAGLHEAQPHLNYDYQVHSEKLLRWVGADYREQQWSYPPTFMLFMAPFALLPYGLALALFMAGSATLLGLALRNAAQGGRWLRDAFLVLASPAGFFGIVSGQVAMLATAAQIYMFRVLDTHPVRAGVLLGLMSIKPQLGLIYPFFLIATGRWRTFFTAAITVLALVLLSLVCWGPDMWDAYRTIGVPSQNEILVHPPQVIAAFIPSIYMDLHFVGASYAVGVAVQACVALAVVGALFTSRFRQASKEAQMAVVATGGVLMTPYLMAYDLLFFTYALLIYVRTARLSVAENWVAAGCYMLTMLHFFAGVASIPGFALLPLGMMGILLRHR